MPTLHLQSFIDGEWLDCATLVLDQAERGVGSPCVLDYEVDYFVETSAADALAADVRDLRAVSVRHPVDLASYRSERWLPFVLDLIPQGAMRRRVAAERRWRDDDPRLDYDLLLRGAGSPVGNIRVWEARAEEEATITNADISGVELQSILALDDAFMRSWERAGLVSAGSEGVQGDWPKILMTRSRCDGLWYPDSVLSDADAAEHVLVKRTHAIAAESRSVLSSEPGYMEIARAFGLRAGESIAAGRDVIVIPRFDRRIADGAVLRFGQESLASATGISEFGASARHMSFVDAIRRFATDPEAEVIEYVLRDLLNLAAGNPDNHGRNTAFRKHADGRIELAPLFDFAPMKLLHDGPRVTRWTGVTNDVSPDWTSVAEAVCEGLMDPRRLLAELASREQFLRDLPARARAAGVGADVIEIAMARCPAVADSLAAIPKTPRR